jgi:BirA family transcriptional regulator, biotin operon repressor / biotin---[acetyl-CoA-carboxylase] ligase
LFFCRNRSPNKILGMDKLSKQALHSAVAGTIFAGKTHVFDEIDSTNSAAMLAAQAGAAEGTVFLAERQTEGRGRGGNSWYSEGDAIYLSVVLRPKVSANDVLILSLATGLAVSFALEDTCAVVADLRWPNDVMLREKKLGGILCELNIEAANVRHAVLGIGLNVNQEEFPDGIRQVATSLFQETGKKWPRLELTAALLRALQDEYVKMQTAPAQAMRSCIARFEARSSYARGKRVAVAEAGGFEGTTDGLDERGFLRVKTPTGPRLVVSGGVRPA